MPRMVLFYRRPDAHRWAMAFLPPSFTTRAAAERELVHDRTVTIEDKDGTEITTRDYVIGAAPADAKQDPVAAEVIRRLYRGDLVPSVIRVGAIPSPLVGVSVVLVAAGPLRNYVMDRLRTAGIRQHERAILEQQFALAALPDEAKPWGVCRYCGRVYLLRRPDARRDLCARPRCRKTADRERKRAEYARPETRRKKIADATARRRRARAGSCKVMTSVTM